MRIALVVAVARNGVIGAGGKLPWRISDDLKWFKSVTLGKPVVMGRKTFESIGRPLAGRDNIVVSRAPGYSVESAIVRASVDAALTAATECATRSGAQEICVIGGSEIYAQTLSRASRIYLTSVEADIDGDAHFPEFDAASWARSEVGRAEKGPRNDHDCVFVILDRIAPF